MRKKLTTKTIDCLSGAGKRYEVRDALVPGLHMRVSPNGGRVWYVSARIDGRSQRIKIGRYPVISLADARMRAQEILRDVALGTYARRSPEPIVPTLGRVIVDFIELHARPRTKDWRGTERILDKFKDVHSRPIDEIKRAEIVRVLDDIIRSGAPFRANRALAAIKKLFSWCVERGMLDFNPIAGLRPPTKEVSRDRVLTDDELTAIWRASEGEGFPFASVVKLLILTGQRRNEVAGMRWSEIDFDRMTWTIGGERAKNGAASIVPLTPIAIDIIRATPRFLKSDLVFTTNGRNPVSGFGRLKRRLDAATGVSNWRLHDIRRTAATGMAALGVEPHVIEAVLNHRSGIVSGVAAVYNRHAYSDEKRNALSAWANHMQSLLKPPQSVSKDTLGKAAQRLAAAY